jgi:hypothetical protein
VQKTGTPTSQSMRLICLNGPPVMDLDMQLELFEQALGELEADANLVNQVRNYMGRRCPTRGY